jgi:hypothetical protein
MIDSNYKSIEEENIPVGIHPLKHSHSLAPCAPAFLVGATGRRKRVPKKEGHLHLYSPSLGHPPRPPRPAVGPPLETPPSVGHPSSPPSGHSRSPSGTRAPSVGHPSGYPSALLTHWVSRATLVAPSGHSVRPTVPQFV